MITAELKEFVALDNEKADIKTRLKAIETRLGEIHRQMADPAFFRQAAADIVRAKANLQDLEKDLAESYRRWEELEALRE